MELLTIPFSHYNERARWALCHHGVAVRERRVLPGLHLLAVRRATRPEHRRADATSSPLSTPVLDTGREVLASSTAIVDWVDRTRSTPETTLYPAAHASEIRALERDVHDSLGPATRAIAYYHLSRSAPLFADLVHHNFGPVQRAFFRAFGARIGRHVAKRFDDQAHAEAVATVRAHLADMGERLASRDYYFGDRFTAADLTVACMLTPVLMPVPRFGAYLPTVEGAPAAFVDEVRESPAGQHALRAFRDHRPASPRGWQRV